MGGFFGAVSKHKCITDVFYGTDYQFHLGTRRGGIATLNHDGHFEREIHNLENSYFRTRFEGELSKFDGNAGIGVISDTDAQPMLANSHLGRFALVTVAKINNLEELAEGLIREGEHLSEFTSGRINPTELVSLLIIRGRTFVEGIENVFRHIQGSCSMLILTEKGIIAARDSWGRTPIVVGKKMSDNASAGGSDGNANASNATAEAYAVTSETTAFPNLGYQTAHYLGPGEVVMLNADGYKQLRRPNRRMQVCSFLWVYYGFPTSCYEGKNVEEVRFRCGEVMGKEDAETQVDCACGIPDSGIGMATGYAAGKGVPYLRCIAKYTPTWPRSFMPPNQATRDLVAKMKLIINQDLLRGKRLLFCDDSIVRGTQLRNNTREMMEMGAKEVHMRIACPPLVYGCRFINFTSSKTDRELITRRIIEDFEGQEPTPEILKEYATTDSPRYQRMVAEIARRLSLSSLKFTKLETLVDAIGLPKDQICTHCFDGSSEFTLHEINE